MFDHYKKRCFASLLTLVLCIPSLAQQSPAPDFIPDVTFDGSDLSDWQAMGSVNWQATATGIEGKARGEGGVLLSSESYQNAAFFSQFRCEGVCDAGILARVESTENGYRAVMVGLEDERVIPYRVELDKQGRITSKVSIQDAPRQLATLDVSGPVLDAANEEMSTPVLIKPAEWNAIEVFLDANKLFNHLNHVRNGVPGASAIEDLPPLAPNEYNGAVVTPDIRTFGFGPFGLYIGSGSVAFKDIALRDLNTQHIAVEQTSDRFRIQQLNEFYYAWGADVADINGDGEQDFISGPFYYLGPSFQQRHEFYQARVFNPGLEYVNDMITFANDWTGDGWVDIVVTERRPLVMYVNAKGENRYWKRVAILPDVCSETAIRADVDGDGAPEIAYVGSDGRIAYGEPDPEHLEGVWRVFKISAPIIAGCNSHGLGVADVDGDGKADVLHARGWWQQPTEGPDQGNWIFHDDAFGRLTRSPQHPGGAEIAVADFNGDGLNDVVASHSAHGWGLAWYEQMRDEAGKISFREHMIMGDFSTPNTGDVTFSQVHSGATVGDIDQDGVMDFVTGKRHWSHLDDYMDPDPHGEAVIYWYRTKRNAEAPGGVVFEPELIHNKSGVGSEVKVMDINGDGRLDIVSAGTHGAFIYWGQE